MKQLFADMHCDTITTLYDRLKEGETGSLYRSSLQLDIDKLKKADYLLQNFAVFFDKEKHTNLYEKALKRIAFWKEEMAKNKEIISQVFSYEDILKNEEKGLISALLTLEGGEILEGSTEKLENLHKEGVRMVTITWNYDNDLGHCHFDTEGKGLTKKGFEMVEAMESMHIIPDVSHGSDTLFYDVCSVAKKPFVASHSNARSVYGRTRNMTDDMIKALANKGGVMGLNYFAGFTSERSRNDGMCYLEDMIAHAKHIINVGGMEVLGLGSDFDGIGTDVEWKDASGMMIFADALKKAGISEGNCDKIFRGNVMRLYNDCL